MLFRLCLLAVAVSHSFAQPVVHNCPLVTASELGSSDTHSDTGIISDALRGPGDASASPALRIFDHQVTCTVAGTAANTFHFLSVVVFFSCVYQAGSLDCADSPTLSGPGNFTAQFELHCININASTLEWTLGDDVGSLVDDTVTNPADGSLTTERDDQCKLCYSRRSRASRLTPTVQYDPDSHCVGKFLCCDT